MKECPSIPFSHCSNRLSSFHNHPFRNLDMLIECIGTQVLQAVTDDDKATIARKSTPDIDHAPRMRRNNRLARRSHDVNATTVNALTREMAGNRAHCRPNPWSEIVVTRQRLWRRCNPLPPDHCSTGRRTAHNPYPFPWIDQIGRGNAVPCGQFTVIQPVMPGDGIKRIPLSDRVNAFLCGLWPVEYMSAAHQYDAAQKGDDPIATAFLHKCLSDLAVSWACAIRFSQPA